MAKQMDYINTLSTTQTAIAATSLVAVLTSIAMGLFRKNQMPVEGKVRMLSLKTTINSIPLT